ncbi:MULTISPECIES: hypothetical protein [Streptomyces]|nr:MULTISPECIES: hypothetical protein [Streptomyces]
MTGASGVCGRGRIVRVRRFLRGVRVLREPVRLGGVLGAVGGG